MRKKRVDEGQAKELVLKLLQSYTPEEIAVKVGKCRDTIRNWQVGKFIPGMGDMELLRQMEEETLV